jgi:predicted metal-dependent hydrolase
LCDDLQKFNKGDNCDELSWKPVRLHSIKIMNAEEDAVFATTQEQTTQKDLLDDARAQGKEIVTIPENVRLDINDEEDIRGDQITTIDKYEEEYEESFTFDFIDQNDLTSKEQQVWSKKESLFKIIQKPDNYNIKISEELRATDNDRTQGVCVSGDNLIVIKRDVLKDQEKFLGILIHEIAHTKTPYPDQTREFENVLTDYLGKLGSECID